MNGILVTGFIFLGYAIFGCIPVFLAGGEIKTVLLILQVVALAVGALLAFFGLKTKRF